MGTLITILLAAALGAYAVWAVLRLRRKGSTCGCGCSDCAMKHSCMKTEK